MKVLNKLKELGQLKLLHNKSQRNAYDTLASLLLHRLFPEHTILPFSPYSLNPNTILHIINDLQLNKRKSILECGSGISTVILARYIALNKLDTKIVSIDQDAQWSAYIKELLIKYDCNKAVKLVVAPMTSFGDNFYQGEWYDQTVVNDALEKETVEVLIVDGPKAIKNPKVRYPALLLAKPLLANNFIIFLDDTRRSGEQQVLEDWKTLFKKSETQVLIDADPKKVYTTLRSKSGFSANPITY